jgi:hypothetical protein
MSSWFSFWFFGRRLSVIFQFTDTWISFRKKPYYSPSPLCLEIVLCMKMWFEFLVISTFWQSCELRAYSCQFSSRTVSDTGVQCKGLQLLVNYYSVLLMTNLVGSSKCVEPNSNTTHLSFLFNSFLSITKALSGEAVLPIIAPSQI